MSTKEVLRLSRVRSLMASGEARRIREAANLSQRDIAQALNVSVPTVSRWENGARYARGDHALAYLDLLEALDGQGAKTA